MALALLRKPWWGLRSTVKTALANNHAAISMATSAGDPPAAVTTDKPPVPEDPSSDAQAVDNDGSQSQAPNRVANTEKPKPLNDPYPPPLHDP